MATMQSLQDEADKARLDAQTQRDTADQLRQQAANYQAGDNAARANDATIQAQKADQQAVVLNDQAAALQKQAADKERELAKLQAQENQLNQQHQAQVDALQKQQQSLRG